MLVAAALFPFQAVQAQTVCGPRAAFVEQLARQHGEQTSALGLAAGGRIVEVLSARGGSWTILVVRPDGVACVLAAGEAWERFAIPGTSNSNPPS